MKRIKLITMVLTAMFVNSAVTFAQDKNNEFQSFKQEEKRLEGSRLNEDQRNALKAVHEKYSESIQDLKQQVAEAKAHQRTLMGKAVADEAAILKNVETIAKLDGEISKKMLAMKTEAKGVLGQEGERMRHGFAMGNAHQRPNSQGQHGKGNSKQFKGQGADRGNGLAMQRGDRGNHMAQRASNRRMGEGVNSQMKERRMATHQESGRRMNDQRARVEGNQKNKGQQRGNGQGMFTEDQKTAMKELRLENAQALTDLKNELNELQVRQRSILMKEEVNLKEANKNIDKMTSIKTDIAKIQAKSKIEFQALLTPEQKVKMSAMKSHVQSKRGTRI